MTRSDDLRIKRGPTKSGNAAIDPNDDGDNSFEHVRSAWNELSSHARYFFQTVPWVELLATRFTSDVRWNVTRRNGRVVFVSILRHRLFSLGGIRLRFLTALYPAPQMPPFADGLIDTDATAQLHFADIARNFGPWHALLLRGIRAESPWLKVSSRNITIVSEPQGGVGIFDTSLSIEERWPTVPKNMRNAIRKARNRIGDRGTFVVSTGDAVATAFDEFVALESAGWKGAAGTSLAQAPSERELLREYFVKSDTVEVRSLHVDGRLAASQLAIRVAGTHFGLKMAYDESIADLSPGNVLFAHMVEACCADPAVNRIDCVAWQPIYERWGMTREPTYELVAFNRRSAGGWIAMIAWSLRARAKQISAVATIVKRASTTRITNKIRSGWRSMCNRLGK